MMKMFTIKEQVVLSGPFRFDATPANVMSILTALEAFQLMPQTIRELDLPSGQFIDRLVFNNDKGLILNFGSGRLDFVLQSVVNSSESVPALDLVTQITTILPRLQSLRIGDFSRLALLKEYLLPENATATKEAYKALFAKRETDDAVDWVYRYCRKETIEQEICNRIIELVRMQGLLQEADKTTQFDRIKLLIDNNTQLENASTRFNNANVIEFLVKLNTATGTQLAVVNSWIGSFYD